MNKNLSPEAFDTCCLSLERALVLARAACYSHDYARAEAIVDAFHNLPRLLLGSRSGHPVEDWSLDKHNQLFLDELLRRYPDLRGSGLDATLTVEHGET